MSSSRCALIGFALCVFIGMPAAARGQAAGSSSSGAPAASAQNAAAATVPDDPDLDFQALQPDFTLVNLPTTLRMARYKSSFRLTHRFTRPLNEGSFTDLLEDFFSFDSSAQIGLEYRFGLMRGTQVGIRRTNDRTITFYTQYSVMQQGHGHPLGIAAYGSIDGTNNFRDSYTPALGAIVSRTLGKLGTAYIEPMWINNANLLPSELVDHNDTFLLGLGARLRVLKTVYVVLEGSPRVAGDTPGDALMSFGVEKVVGGHVFQLNVSNGMGTSPGALARGAESNDDWYLGFNISRKFF